MDPINYDVAPAANPLSGFMSGFKGAIDMRTTNLELKAKEEALKRQTLAQQAMAAIQANPNATATDYANLSMMLPKDQAENVRKSFDMISGDRQRSVLDRSSQVFAAFKSGRPEIAIDIMQKQTDALRRAGDAEGARAMQTWVDVAKADPKQAETFFGFTLSQIPGGDKVIENAIKISREAAAVAQDPYLLANAKAQAEKATADAITAGVTAEFAPRVAATALSKAQSEAISADVNARFAEDLAKLGISEKNWNIKNLQSQMSTAAGRLRLDQQVAAATIAEKMASVQEKLTGIPAGAQTEINKAAVESAASKQQAQQYSSLANRIGEIGSGWGAAGSFAEFLKKSTGSQGAVSELRQEYTRLRNSTAIKSLPPGPATDRDIELALRGLPPETGNPQVIASFLRGMAKMQEIDAATQAAKVDWLAGNRGLLGRAQTPFIAGDYSARAGESFSDFSQRVAQDVAKKFEPKPVTEIPSPSSLPPRPGVIAAPPGAAPARNIRAEADAILRGGR